MKLARPFVLAFALFTVALLAPRTEAATPTFSSFDPLQFYTNSNPTIIHAYTNISGLVITNLTVVSNLFVNNFYTTNLFATNITSIVNVTSNFFTTNLVVGGVQVFFQPLDPLTVTPIVTNAFWVNITSSQLFLWDSLGTNWVAINPSATTGIYAVPSVVELRMIATNGLLQWATTWGNLAPGDGQGRRYWFNASDVRADDGIAIIKPDDVIPFDPGRWNEE